MDRVDQSILNGFRHRNKIDEETLTKNIHRVEVDETRRR